MSRIIKQAKTNPKAFTKLYETHVDAVYQYCAYRLSDKQTAEDLTSEVWETVLLHIHELESNHPIVFKAWLFRIAKNALNKKWKEKKLVPLNEDAERIKDECPSPALLSEQNESASAVRELVNALPEKQKETVALHFFSGLRNKEIALLLETSEKTVASNLSRALDTLHLWLKKLQ